MPLKPVATITPQRSRYGTAMIGIDRSHTLYPDGDVYVATEVPKGELGFYFVSDGTSRPYRMHIRSPSFIHIAALGVIARGELIADLIANIGSLDVVLGESDR
jgi:NADH-quinone oxidoreductase subunit D